MPASRLDDIPGIGSDVAGQLAELAADPHVLRLEAMNTDLRPPPIAVEETHRAIDNPSANRYLPFRGHLSLRTAVAQHVSRFADVAYDPESEILSTLGGLNGITDCLLALVDPGQEVVLTDPVYSGLVNRVTLAGGVPRYARSRASPNGWYTDPEELASLIGPRTAAVLLMGTSMPTGSLLRDEMLRALANAVARNPCWIIYDAAMEYIRFDDSCPLHPTSYPSLRDRTITVGSASKELRMIGWRVGWIAGPAPAISDVHRVALTNVACQVGISQGAVAAALADEGFLDDIRRVTRIWKERAQLMAEQLRPYACIPAEGGWSVLIDADAMEISSKELSSRLLTRGLIASTPMTGWGPTGSRYIRLTFANEPVERLIDLRTRFADALQ